MVDAPHKGRTPFGADIIKRFHNEQIFRDPLTRLNATYCINSAIHISQFLDKLTIKYSVLSFIHFYLQQQFYTQVCYGQVCETLSIMGGRRPLTLQVTWSQEGQGQVSTNNSQFQAKSSEFCMDVNLDHKFIQLLSYQLLYSAISIKRSTRVGHYLLSLL